MAGDKPSHTMPICSAKQASGILPYGRLYGAATRISSLSHATVSLAHVLFGRRVLLRGVPSSTISSTAAVGPKVTSNMHPCRERSPCEVHSPVEGFHVPSTAAGLLSVAHHTFSHLLRGFALAD